jgi:hypothetical protein
MHDILQPWELLFVRRVKKLSRALITVKTLFFDEGDQECQPNA